MSCEAFELYESASLLGGGPIFAVCQSRLDPVPNTESFSKGMEYSSLRNNPTGLGTSNIEDYFVLTSIHDPPIKVVQLEAYINAVTQLLSESLAYIKDENTKNTIRKEISNAMATKTNLGDAFFKEAKKSLGISQDEIIWPKDFPTVKILNATKTTVKLFSPNEVDFFLNKKREVESSLATLCNIYNPIMLIAFSTIQMQLATTSTNPEFAEFFKGVWTGKRIDYSVLEKIAQEVTKTGFRKFAVKATHETYRQMVLTGIDLQRALRERLYYYCSKGVGENTMISEYVFLQLFECLYSIFSINWIENMMNESQLPIFVLENEYTSVFIPLISANDSLPFQKELNDRERRLLFQHASSKATNEEKIPQWQFFLQNLSKFELNQLHFLIWYLGETPSKFVIFPKSEAQRIFNERQEFPEELISEWIDGPKSPFVKVKWKDEDYYLATHIIIEDKFFRIMWKAHQGKHIRIRGTRFEDFVLDVLQKQFPNSLTAKNKYFFATVSGKEKRYEIDRTFVLKDLFFLIECKNLLLIEDLADIRKLRSRNQELKGYGEYLEFKGNLLKDNYCQLETKIPLLRRHNCTRVIPVVLSLYPDILSFHKVPFLTIYEFVRYVSACEREGRFLESFSDFSGTTFNFPSFEIRRENTLQGSE